MTSTVASDALKTYRYLRLAMVACVLLLAASIVLELDATGGSCWPTSISAFYYTPSRAVLVGTLVAVGVCLVVVKGNTVTEDVLLNLAGCLAPVVAFVPVAPTDPCVTPLVSGTQDAVANNVGALLVVGALSLALAAWLARREAGPAGPPRPVVLGLLAGVCLLVAGTLWFWLGRESFLRFGHYAAAIPLFGCMLAVVLANALAMARETAGSGRRSMTARDLVNGYLAVAVLAVGSLVILGLVTWLADWAHGLFWVEASQIALFAWFWVLQTRELWGVGVRAR